MFVKFEQNLWERFWDILGWSFYCQTYSKNWSILMFAVIFRKQSTLGIQFYLIVISIDLKTCVKDHGGSFSRLREKRIWLACIEVPLLNYCLVITVFLTTKTLSQNISKTLLQILFKLHEHWSKYWKNSPLWVIVEKKLRAPRNTAVSKIENAVAMTTLVSTKNAHNKFSSFSDKAMVIFC